MKAFSSFVALLLLALPVLAQDVEAEKVSKSPLPVPTVSLAATADPRAFAVSVNSKLPVYLASIEVVAQGTGLAGLASVSGGFAGSARMRSTAGNYARVLFYVGSMIPAGTTTFTVRLPGSPFFISLAFQEAVLWSPTRDDLVLEAVTVGATIGEPKKIRASSRSAKKATRKVGKQTRKSSPKKQVRGGKKARRK
jgi:hypothetical protein